MSKVKHAGKIKHKGVRYHLAYADFKSLKGWIGKRKGEFYIVISDKLLSMEKSKEFHKLLKDKSKFEHGGRKNISGWMS